MNPVRLFIAAFSFTAFVAIASPSDSQANTNDYRCSSNFSMSGNVSNNSVHCTKPGSETLRNNYPVCGIRRYKENGRGNTDTCTKTNGTHTGFPKCIGGTKSVRSGKDRCVNKAPTVNRPAVHCPSGYQMQGNTSGRGSVHCYKPPVETLRNNYPVCGIRRYKENGQGNTDTCTKTNGTHTGVPKCIGGTKSVRSGKDRCVNKTPGRTIKPS